MGIKLYTFLWIVLSLDLGAACSQKFGIDTAGLEKAVGRTSIPSSPVTPPGDDGAHTGGSENDNSSKDKAITFVSRIPNGPTSQELCSSLNERAKTDSVLAARLNAADHIQLSQSPAEFQCTNGVCECPANGYCQKEANTEGISATRFICNAGAICIIESNSGAINVPFTCSPGAFCAIRTNTGDVSGGLSCTGNSICSILGNSGNFQSSTTCGAGGYCCSEGNGGGTGNISCSGSAFCGSTSNGGDETLTCTGVTGGCTQHTNYGTATISCTGPNQGACLQSSNQGNLQSSCANAASCDQLTNGGSLTNSCTNIPGGCSQTTNGGKAILDCLGTSQGTCRQSGNQGELVCNGKSAYGLNSCHP